MQDPEIRAAAGRLSAALSAAKAELVERDEVVDLIGLSMLAGQHVFLCGLPGVAKSLVFDLVFSRVEGARTGFYALTKGSTPETLVGSISPRALRDEDRFRHNTEGMLPSVHLAFIDECFKGNALTRNAALQVLNERVFFNGGTVEPAPLITCGAASNEYPDTVEDSAFWDRFLVRYEVARIGEHSARWKMIRQGLRRERRFGEAETGLSIADLRLLTEARRDVALPDELEEADLRLVNGLAALGGDAALGDRRAQHSYALAQAKALLDGRDAVEPQDLLVFAHTAWHNPNARRAVQQAVLKAVNPELADVTRCWDEIELGYEQFLQQLAQANNDIMRKMAANKQFADAAQGNLEDMQRIIRKLRAEQKDDSQALDLFQRAQGRIHDANRLAVTQQKELTV